MGDFKKPCIFKWAGEDSLSHHLAFMSVHGGDVFLPDNLGMGSSISHLCDTAGCISVDHLEYVPAHVTNLNRQRCLGVTLIVSLDLIIHEVPCQHGVGDTVEARISSSCRKLRMVQLPPYSVTALFENHTQIAEAMQSSPLSSQVQ